MSKIGMKLSGRMLASGIRPWIQSEARHGDRQTDRDRGKAGKEL